MTSTQVRSLGVTIDAGLVFASQISQLVRTSYYQLRQLRSIRGSLSVHGFVPYTCSGAHILSRLDYCNGLLYGSSAELIGKLDGVMRSAARLILKRQRFDHISTSHAEMNSSGSDITTRIMKTRCDYNRVSLPDNITAPRYLSFAFQCILTGKRCLVDLIWDPMTLAACLMPDPLSDSNNWTVGFSRGLIRSNVILWKMTLKVPGITQGVFRNA